MPDGKKLAGRLWLRVPRKGLIGPWSHKYPHIAVPGPAIGPLTPQLSRGAASRLSMGPVSSKSSLSSQPTPNRSSARWAKGVFPPIPAFIQERVRVGFASLIPAAENTLQRFDGSSWVPMY